MIYELAILIALGALLAHGFKIAEIILVSGALAAFWLACMLFGLASPAQASIHLILDLIALQSGTFAILYVRSRAQI